MNLLKFKSIGLLLLILFIVVAILDLWAVLDISKHSYKKRSLKWAWTNVVLFFPLLGVVFYMFYGKKQLEEDAS